MYDNVQVMVWLGYPSGDLQVHPRSRLSVPSVANVQPLTQGMVDVQLHVYNTARGSVNVILVIQTRGQVPVVNRALGIQPTGLAEV